MLERARPTAGVRLLGAVSRAAPMFSAAFSVADMDDPTIRRMQSRDLPHNVAVDVMLGRRRHDVRISNWSFAGPGGQVRVRVYTPTGPAARPWPAVLHLHGGGFVLGSARQNDWISSNVAAGAGVVVVAPEYRLAPADPFPAAVDDAWASLEWLLHNATEFGADPERLGVMGESAGGNLAAVLALLARDAGGPELLHQGLLYPAVQLDEALGEDGSLTENVQPIMLSNDDLRVFSRLYLDGADATDWRASPLYAPDHAGLPPTTVVLAGLDPLRDAGARYAQRLADAGVPVTVELFHRMPHGFLTFPYLCRSARPALDALVRDQRAAFS